MTLGILLLQQLLEMLWQMRLGIPFQLIIGMMPVQLLLRINSVQLIMLPRAGRDTGYNTFAAGVTTGNLAG